jgi:hypothetical protein
MTPANPGVLSTPTTAARLHRVRWAVRSTLVLGVAASVVANVLHALDNPISQTIAAWPPLALLLTVELISRIPVHSRGLGVVRMLAAASIAGIAAYVSYWHMVGVAARYGETGISPYLLPLSVDGLIVVASICLVELAGRIRDGDQGAAVAQPASRRPAPAPGRAPAFLAPASAPPAAVDEPVLGAPAAEDPAAQEVRQDDRTAQQIEVAVRAMRAAEPRMSQRQIAAAVITSPSNVRRILQRPPEPEVAHPANDRARALEGTAV